MNDRKPDDKERDKASHRPAGTAGDERIQAHVRAVLAQLQARMVKGRQR